jgi:hypothetical protein
MSFSSGRIFWVKQHRTQNRKRVPHFSKKAKFRFSPHVKYRRPPAGKTQKWKFFQKRRKRLWNFTSILSWKSWKPRKCPSGISEKCARSGIFGVIFDTFSMLRQIATALFSIKTPKFQCFRHFFLFFCVFLLFFTFCKFVTFPKKMSENVPIFPEILRVPAAQSVFCKRCFFGTNFPNFEITKCPGISWILNFPEFVPWGSKKASFIHL